MIKFGLCFFQPIIFLPDYHETITCISDILREHRVLIKYRQNYRNWNIRMQNLSIISRHLLLSVVSAYLGWRDHNYI